MDHEYATAPAAGRAQPSSFLAETSARINDILQTVARGSERLGQLGFYGPPSGVSARGNEPPTPENNARAGITNDLEILLDRVRILEQQIERI